MGLGSFASVTMGTTFCRRSAGPCASISQQCRWEFGVRLGIGSRRLPLESVHLGTSTVFLMTFSVSEGFPYGYFWTRGYKPDFPRRCLAALWCTPSQRSGPGQPFRSHGTYMHRSDDIMTSIHIHPSIHPSVHPSIHTYIHTYLRTYVRTYIHTTYIHT